MNLQLWRSPPAGNAISPPEPVWFTPPLKRNQGQFDFAFQPSIEEYVVEALSNLANAAQAADIL